MNGELEQQAADWNAAYPVGTPMRYWPGRRDGRSSIGRVKHPMTVMGGQLVAWIRGHSGCLAASHVLPLSDLETLTPTDEYALELTLDGDCLNRCRRGDVDVLATWMPLRSGREMLAADIGFKEGGIYHGHTAELTGFRVALGLYPAGPEWREGLRWSIDRGETWFQLADDDEEGYEGSSMVEAGDELGLRVQCPEADDSVRITVQLRVRHR